MKIDNFALTIHQSCPAKYDLRMNHGWQLRRRSAALGFGGAFHAGMAEWYRTGDSALGSKAIIDSWDSTTPVDDYRTMAKCLDVFREYVNEYPTESFSIVGKPDHPIIEQTFTLPLGTWLDCQCGAEQNMWESHCKKCDTDKEPIEYGGIFDGLAQFGDKVFVLEHKTTSQLGDYYFTQYKPNNQVTGYIWAASQMSGLEVGGALINAIGIYKTGKTKFKRQLSTRDATDIAQWVRNVTASCEEIKFHERNGFWPQRTTSCTQYGLCEFHQVHTLSEPEWQQKRLEQDYTKEKWDYTRRDENAPTGE